MHEVKTPKKPLIYYYIIAMVVVLLLNALFFPSVLETKVVEVAYSDFLTMVDDGLVQEVALEESSGQLVFTAEQPDNSDKIGIYKTGIWPDDGQRLLEQLRADAPRVAFGRQAYYTPGPDPTPAPGETPFDRTPYDPARYDARTIKRNLLLYDDGISGCGMVYERDLLKGALEMMAGRVLLAEDFAVRLFAVQGVPITRYDRLTSWYEYGSGVSTNETARQRMAAEWQAMVELLQERFPSDPIVRLARAYFFNDRRKNRLVRGLVGRLIVPQNAPFKKAQRAWQPPVNGNAEKLRAIYAAAARP